MQSCIFGTSVLSSDLSWLALWVGAASKDVQTGALLDRKLLKEEREVSLSLSLSFSFSSSLRHNYHLSLSAHNLQLSIAKNTRSLFLLRHFKTHSKELACRICACFRSITGGFSISLPNYRFHWHLKCSALQRNNKLVRCILCTMWAPLLFSPQATAQRRHLLILLVMDPADDKVFSSPCTSTAFHVVPREYNNSWMTFCSLPLQLVI